MVRLMIRGIYGLIRASLAMTCEQVGVAVSKVPGKVPLAVGLTVV